MPLILRRARCCKCAAGQCCQANTIAYVDPVGDTCVELFTFPVEDPCGTGASDSEKWTDIALPGTHVQANPLSGMLDPEDPCGAFIDEVADDLCWEFSTTLRNVGTRLRWFDSGSCFGIRDDEVDLYAVIYGGFLRARQKMFAVVEAVLNPSDPERDHLIFAGVAAFDGRCSSLPVVINNQLSVGKVCCIEPPSFRRIDAGASGGSITISKV